MRTIGTLIVRARPGHASARLVGAKRVRGLALYTVARRAVLRRFEAACDAVLPRTRHVIGGSAGVLAGNRIGGSGGARDGRIVRARPRRCTQRHGAGL